MADNSKPNKSWSLEQLADYIDGNLTANKTTQEQILSLGHRSAVEFYRIGKALLLAKPLVQKAGQKWQQWKKDHGISDPQASYAMRIAKNAKNEAEVEKMNLTECKVKFAGFKRGENDKQKGKSSKLSNNFQTALSKIVQELVRIDGLNKGGAGVDLKTCQKFIDDAKALLAKMAEGIGEPPAV